MHLHVMIWMWCWKYYINIRVCFCSYSTFSQYRSDLEVDTYIHYSRTLKETSNTVESLNSDYMRGRKEKSGKIHLHCGFHLFFLVCIWTVFFAVFPANWFKRPKKIKYGNSAFSSWSLYSFMLPHFHSSAPLVNVCGICPGAGCYGKKPWRKIWSSWATSLCVCVTAV